MEKRIFSAGPWITEKEISFVNDAIKNGWYDHYNDYVEKFEFEFSKYMGTKYSIATPNGTSALHLSLAALDIKPGDEVIVPDISWAATADVVLYTGATPVFADVDKETWTINLSSLESLINKRTKVIIPVHLYGNMCDMEKLMDLSKKHNLFVVEDAAPAVGSNFKGKKAGSFGNTGCFSFQGSKLLATGEGGMFITNDKKLYEKARCLSEHGRDDNKMTFWCSNMGFQYTMSNLSASLGLAQLLRVDELIQKKREIFNWYVEELKNVEGIHFVYEGKNVFSNYSYPSISIGNKFRLSRDQLIQDLKKNNIDCRPAFPRMSNFPHFKQEVKNVNAKYVEECGLNLPCAYKMTKDDVKRVSKVIKGK